MFCLAALRVCTVRHASNRSDLVMQCTVVVDVFCADIQHAAYMHAGQFICPLQLLQALQGAQASSVVSKPCFV